MLRNKKEFRLLTAARGVAALWVVLYHVRDRLSLHISPHVVDVISLGYVAVDFFFVLSGFVISLSYSKVFSENILFKSFVFFIIKRIFRIYPLHLVVLILYLIIPILYFVFDKQFFFEGRFAIEGYVYSLLLINNWGIVDTLPWNVPAWSISAELFAYLCFPILIFCMSRLNRGWTVGAALVSSLVILLLIFDKYGSGSIGSNIATLGIFRCVAEFILGIVIFKLYQSGFIDNINWKTLAFCWSTLVMVIFIGLPDYYYLPLLIFFSILGFVKFEKDSEVNIGAFLNWLGIVSYSIYLCHYLIKDVLKLILETEYTPIWWLILYIVLTLIMSHFMYNYVEVRGVKLFEKLKR